MPEEQVKQTETQSENKVDAEIDKDDNLLEECTATFKPVVTLPIVQVRTFEEDEKVLLKIRAKLYRFDTNADQPEWKERGTGELKVLKHPKNRTVRIVMRRDKTLKVCANHFILGGYELKPVKYNERAFIYTSLADYADEMLKNECFAVKFTNVECANKFKDVFNYARGFVEGTEIDSPIPPTDDDTEEELQIKLDELEISASDVPPASDDTCDN